MSINEKIDIYLDEENDRRLEKMIDGFESLLSGLRTSLDNLDLKISLKRKRNIDKQWKKINKLINQKIDVMETE
jgi:hypothetical protein